MSPEELTLFHEHPLKGAKMLEAIPSIDPITVQAVAQHHERRSKHGFPLHLGAGAINKVAEIIGISDEFLRLSEETSQEKGMTLAQRMETQVFQDFSFDVTEAFRKVFTT
jgi:HD-GYP domain-containing protein (c-di-GMP phosphodiesterase class II)